MVVEKPIKIAILDAVPESCWADDEGITDSQKFVDLLAPVNAQAAFDIYFVSKYEFPQSIDDYDAFLVTGSPASVHDDYDWIQQLSQLLVDVNKTNKQIVASCFGHQLVAKTFGGEVGKNEQGWMIGNIVLNITRQYEWMRPSETNTGIYHFNQERVTRLPDDAQSFANTASYPYYAYTMGENIMCLQGHPEQPLRAMNNFLAATENKLPDEELERAKIFIDSGEPDADIWAQWMMRFMTV